MKTAFLFCLILLYCSSEVGCSNINDTVEILPVFPHIYHGTSAYYAGDTLGTDFGVSFTIMHIERADSVFNASIHDSLVLSGSSVTTDYKADGNSTDHVQLHFNVAFDDGSNGVAVFNSSKMDSLVITLQSFLTAKFETPYNRIYKVIK